MGTSMFYPISFIVILHSEAMGAHASKSELVLSHHDIVERYGINAITSGLSREDTEKLWDNYNTGMLPFFSTHGYKILTYY